MNQHKIVSIYPAGHDVPGLQITYSLGLIQVQANPHHQKKTSFRKIIGRFYHY
jgi:hypothetical protein